MFFFFGGGGVGNVRVNFKRGMLKSLHLYFLLSALGGGGGGGPNDPISLLER